MTNATLSRFGTHDNSAYPQLWRGCVGAWCPSLGPSGSRLHDYSRRNNWGTLTNMDPATDWVVSGGAYALDFDGSNDNVRTATSESVYNLSAITVSAWVLATNSSGERFIYNENMTPPPYEVLLILRVVNGKSQFWRWGTSGWSASSDPSDIPLNSWQHLAGTFSSASGTVLYRNGVSVASAATDGMTDRTITSVGWGAFVGTSVAAWSGAIDDMRVYNRALTPPEIRLLALRRGIAFTPRTRRLGVIEQAAGGATPWLYARRRSQIIGAGGIT